MNFQITALPAEGFAPLFSLSDAMLKQHNTVRRVVQAGEGVPCRGSLQEAEAGETVILTNYAHQPGYCPYQASHAIYVRDGVGLSIPEVFEIPDMIQTRLVSLRCFSRDHMIVHADVMPGGELDRALADAFEDSSVTYAHIHFAKPGCFAARVDRVG